MRFISIFGERQARKIYFYEVMYQLPIKSTYDAMMAESVVRYLNEQLGLSLCNIKPSLIIDVMNYAKNELSVHGL